MRSRVPNEQLSDENFKHTRNNIHIDTHIDNLNSFRINYLPVTEFNNYKLWNKLSIS